MIALAALGRAPGQASSIVRLSQDLAGDSKPIILYADEMVTWLDGKTRIVLLQGTVLVQQGVVHARAPRGVAWIDQQKSVQKGITDVDLYAEGGVHVERGTESRDGTQAFIDLHTRGEIKIRAQKSKVIEASRPDDRLYRRAVAVRSQLAEAAAIQRTSAFEPAADEKTVVQAQATPPVPGGMLPAPAPPPAAAAPNMQAPAAPDSATAPPATMPPLVPAAPPPTPPPAAAPLPPPATAASTLGPPRQFQIAPRTSGGFQVDTRTLPNGEQAIFAVGGVILTIRDLGNINLLDIEADRLVLWTRSGNLQQLFSNMRSPSGETTRESEFYLSGNVEIRAVQGKLVRTIRADEMYYDVGRNVAVARRADLEFKQPGLPDPVHLRADELLQTAKDEFKGYRAEVFSSRLPSDPGLKLYVQEATLDEVHVPKRSIFGRQVLDRNGQPVVERQDLVRADNVFLELESVPFLYLPFLQGDANDPLGPLEQVNVKYDRIFGGQLFTTFNAYDLIGIDPIPGTRWRFDVDYLIRRGPALATDYEYSGSGLFGLPGKYTGLVKAYGINDEASDILGGPRGQFDNHPEWRGRILERHMQELPEDFTLQTQISALSDKNFLEQYFKTEFDRDINQETFAYLKQERDNWAWTLLVEPRIRNWVTETEWLPRGDGYLVGQSFFDRLTYNAHASVAFAKLEPTHAPPPPFEATDVAVSTLRADLYEELSFPFYLGPVRVVPYGVLDLTAYTEDVTGSERGRLYEGGGVRASIPFTRLYPDVQSEYLNVNGLNHKIVLSGNFFAAHSDTTFSRLPQLDRLNDDATDQALRDIRPLEPLVNPMHGTFLATSPLFDPQLYAIRRLVDDRIDTLDSIDVLEVDIRQRLQTKRGYPGMQHIVDWMTLDLSGSYFPERNRDNFGESLAFLQYDYTWNVGDRTTLVSTGWVDPIDNGPRVFTVGAFFNRPDRTNFYLGYRQIDPVESQALTAAINYVFSPKYAMTASSTYDFGTNQSLSNSLVFTRMGSDLQVSLGVTYNAILNTFGVTFEIFPNLVPEAHRIPGMAALSTGPGR
jgi:hypothetical protein